MHVLHHIEPAERDSVLQTLARLPKKGGGFLIRERVEASHGIPPADIDALLSRAGLKEITHDTTKSEYRGLFSR